MPERLKAILDKITAWWKKFNTKQRSVLISIVAVVIVALVILGVVISRPTQVELVEAQSASEASTIKGVLEDNNISYEVDSKLVFFVNKSDEVNAIMALGDNGIPAQAYSIDNVTDGSFSTTEADKQKKYQVYLEDKLKDHLEKQSYVNEASVDITMPDKDGTILKSKEEATAAVTLGLKDSITDDQAYAIARLVATCTIDMDFYEVRYDDKAESELEFCKKMYKNHAINSKNMNTVKSVILDISGGGIRFSLSTPLEEGTYFMAQFSLALEECTQQFNIVCKVINCTQSLDYADRYFARSKFIFDRMTEREKIVRFVFEEERRIRRREME